jgi:hypothetical protein
VQSLNLFNSNPCSGDQTLSSFEATAADISSPILTGCRPHSATPVPRKNEFQETYFKNEQFD